MRSWDECVVSWPTGGGHDLTGRRGREDIPCMTVQRLAEKAHAQRQVLRCRRGAARLVGHVQQADAPTRDGRTSLLMLNPLAALPTFAVSPQGTWQQLNAAAPNF